LASIRITAMVAGAVNVPGINLVDQFVLNPAGKPAAA
jgi:hypothetical protein